MRRHFLHMEWKKIVCVPFFLLLMVSTTTTGVGPTSDPASVYVYPSMATISAPGENVTIQVRVANVTDLYGFEVYIGFNTSLLEFVSMVATGTNQTVHGTPGVDYLFSVVTPPTTSPDTVAGVCGWFTRPSFNASGPDWGVLVWVTFRGTTNETLLPATSAIDLCPHTGVGECTLIGNSVPVSIPHTQVDGEIEVVPEFPAAIAAPLLLIATLAATLLAKMVWSRKRRGPAVT